MAVQVGSGKELKFTAWVRYEYLSHRLTCLLQAFFNVFLYSCSVVVKISTDIAWLHDLSTVPEFLVSFQKIA